MKRERERERNPEHTEKKKRNPEQTEVKKKKKELNSQEESKKKRSKVAADTICGSPFVCLIIILSLSYELWKLKIYNS